MDPVMGGAHVGVAGVGTHRGRAEAPSDHSDGANADGESTHDGRDRVGTPEVIPPKQEKGSHRVGDAIVGADRVRTPRPRWGQESRGSSGIEPAETMLPP